jgi:hypothetical protein
MSPELGHKTLSTFTGQIIQISEKGFALKVPVTVRTLTKTS